MAAFEIWSAAMVGALVASASTVALWPGLRGWRRPVLVGAAILTTMRFWPVEISLFLGQVNSLVLLAFTTAIAAAVNGRPYISAVLLGLGGGLKTWPILFGFGLLGRPTRPGPIITFILVGLAAPGLALALGGTSWVVSMATGSSDMASQRLISHSIFGFTDLAFDERAWPHPLSSPRLSNWQLASC